MEWLSNLLFGTGIAHSVLLLAITVSLGIILGKIKIAGISLGSTWILFVGIALSHFGMRMESETLHFVKEFGLILFVYSIGLQVGPGFFSSFKKGGLKLNLLATIIVLLGVTTAYVIHQVTGTEMTTMVGILSGAVTNTPGLGAAQQAYTDATGASDPSIALGYAVAYPLGVVGIILSIILIKYLFRINFEKEDQTVEKRNEWNAAKTEQLSVIVKNPALVGKSIGYINKIIGKPLVVSRLQHADRQNNIEIVQASSTINLNDKLLIVASSADTDTIATIIGEKIDMPLDTWVNMDSKLVPRRILITKPALNGKRIGDLNLRNAYGVNVTRVNRAGVDLVATANLQLQIGDRVTVVGREESIAEVSKALGNSMKRLREPNLIPIFVGIVFGVLLGSIPFVFPGIPQPVKLGLAGGPLIVSILISRFGPKYKLVTYTTMSANMMLREVGISLFLASVGLGAGEGFVETIVYKGGYIWILYGFIITVVPLLLAGAIGRLYFKLDYYSLMGLIAGSTTDPPALAYSNSTVSNDVPAVTYATVYPLSMFLRVLTAQILILFSLG